MFYKQYAGLKKDLPLNVHLLTLEAWDESTYLLRLEHYYEKDSDKNLSQPVSVSLKVKLIFMNFKS